MRHYESEQWVDFARDVVEENQKVQMQEHIAEGCKKCLKMMSFWIRFQKTARHESAYQISDATVHSINASFSGQPAKPSRNPKNSLARLLFDSAREPLPAGVRSAGAQPHHQLYGTGRYRIDVRLEPQHDSDQIAVVGQILNSLKPDERLADLPVTLLRGQRVLAKCSTNVSGEFYAQCLLEGGFRINVALPGGNEIGSPLIDPARSHPVDLLYLNEKRGLTGSGSVPKRGTGKKV
ncbi:MAG TPA: hypothetical protein VGD60_14435 [Candidatus Acidoferrales bacterium]